MVSLSPSRRRLVLWGARRGDIQFGSRDDWRRHIPVGAQRMTVEAPGYWDVGMPFEVVHPGDPASWDMGPTEIMICVGKEGHDLGFEPLAR